jgi:hypothetical protein
MTSHCHHKTYGLRPHDRYFVDILVEDFGISRQAAVLLECRDVHNMVATVARSQYLARTERRLLLDEFPPALPKRHPVDRLPGLLLWAVLLLGGTLTLIFVCSPVWQTFAAIGRFFA